MRAVRLTLTSKYRNHNSIQTKAETKPESLSPSNTTCGLRIDPGCLLSDLVLVCAGTGGGGGGHMIFWSLHLELTQKEKPQHCDGEESLPQGLYQPQAPVIHRPAH